MSRKKIQDIFQDGHLSKAEQMLVAAFVAGAVNSDAVSERVDFLQQALSHHLRIAMQAKFIEVYRDVQAASHALSILLPNLDKIDGSADQAFAQARIIHDQLPFLIAELHSDKHAENDDVRRSIRGFQELMRKSVPSGILHGKAPANHADFELNKVVFSAELVDIKASVLSLDFASDVEHRSRLDPVSQTTAPRMSAKGLESVPTVDFDSLTMLRTGIREKTKDNTLQSSQVEDMTVLARLSQIKHLFSDFNLSQSSSVKKGLLGEIQAHIFAAVDIRRDESTGRVDSFAGKDGEQTPRQSFAFANALHWLNHYAEEQGLYVDSALELVAVDKPATNGFLDFVRGNTFRTTASFDAEVDRLLDRAARIDFVAESKGEDNQEIALHIALALFQLNDAYETAGQMHTRDKRAVNLDALLILRNFVNQAEVSDLLDEQSAGMEAEVAASIFTIDPQNASKHLVKKAPGLSAQKQKAADETTGKGSQSDSTSSRGWGFSLPSFGRGKVEKLSAPEVVPEEEASLPTDLANLEGLTTTTVLNGKDTAAIASLNESVDRSLESASMNADALALSTAYKSLKKDLKQITKPFKKQKGPKDHLHWLDLTILAQSLKEFNHLLLKKSAYGNMAEVNEDLYAEISGDGGKAIADTAGDIVLRSIYAAMEETVQALKAEGKGEITYTYTHSEDSLGQRVTKKQSLSDVAHTAAQQDADYGSTSSLLNFANTAGNRVMFLDTVRFLEGHKEVFSQQSEVKKRGTESEFHTMSGMLDHYKAVLTYFKDLMLNPPGTFLSSHEYKGIWSEGDRIGYITFDSSEEAESYLKSQEQRAQENLSAVGGASRTSTQSRSEQDESAAEANALLADILRLTQQKTNPAGIVEVYKKLLLLNRMQKNGLLVKDPDVEGLGRFTWIGKHGILPMYAGWALQPLVVAAFKKNGYEEAPAVFFELAEKDVPEGALTDAAFYPDEFSVSVASELGTDTELFDSSGMGVFNEVRSGVEQQSIPDRFSTINVRELLGRVQADLQGSNGENQTSLLGLMQLHADMLSRLSELPENGTAADLITTLDDNLFLLEAFCTQPAVYSKMKQLEGLPVYKVRVDEGSEGKADSVAAAAWLSKNASDFIVESLDPVQEVAVDLPLTRSTSGEGKQQPAERKKESSSRSVTSELLESGSLDLLTDSPKPPAFSLDTEVEELTVDDHIQKACELIAASESLEGESAIVFSLKAIQKHMIAINGKESETVGKDAAANISLIEAHLADPANAERLKPVVLSASSVTLMSSTSLPSTPQRPADRQRDNHRQSTPDPRSTTVDQSASGLDLFGGKVPGIAETQRERPRNDSSLPLDALNSDSDEETGTSFGNGSNES